MLRRNRSRGSAVRRSNNNNNGARPAADRGVYERPESRPRYGVASQNYERYMNQAKEALSSGDRVQAEYYYQHADHFLRILNEYREQRENQQMMQAATQTPSEQSSAPVADVVVKSTEPVKPESAAVVEAAQQPDEEKRQPRRTVRRRRPKTEEGTPSADTPTDE